MNILKIAPTLYNSSAETPPSATSTATSEVTGHRTSYSYPSEHQTDQQSQQLTTWSNITLDNRIFLTDSSMTTAGQVIHAHEAAQVVGVDPEASVEDDDEGYRTSPGSDTSPQSNNTASPPPKMAKKVCTVFILLF